ncbi:MAG: hypothetical protein ACRD3D_09490 [Terriglobia bacterium]
MMRSSNRYRRSRWAGALLCVLASAAVAAEMPKTPVKTGGRQPATARRKYGTVGPSGADQVLSAVYDSSTKALRVEGAASGSGGGGTVTSVGLAMPGTFTVTGSPIVSGGTISVNWAQPVSILNGGTGQTTAAAAFNALAPPTSAGGLLYGVGPNSYGNLALGAGGQCLGSTGAALVWTICGGTSSNFQVNGANTSSQSPINLQSGGYITVTNPSAGNVQFNFNGPLTVANGGTGLIALGASGQCLQVNSAATALQYGTCGSGGAGVALETNSVNNSSQSTLNLVAGTNVTLANTGGGNVTISAASGSGNATGLTFGSTVLVNSSTPPTAGQFLEYNGTSVVGGTPTGSLPASWSVAAATNAVTAQPAGSQDATTLTLAPSLTSGGTADIFDVCSTNPCSNGTKYFWVSYNGNMGMSGNQWQLGTSAQAAQSYLRMYGGSTPNAPAYLDLLDSTGTHRTDLFSSVSTAGIACVGSALPAGDCGPAVSGTNTLVSFASSGTAPTTGNCVKWTSSSQVGDAGAACGSGGGGAVVYSTQQAESNAGIASTTMVTPAANHVYRFSASLVITTAASCTGTQPTANLYLNYTDSNYTGASTGNVVVPVSYDTAGGAFLSHPNMAGATGYVAHFAPTTISAATGQPVSYEVLFTAGTTCSANPSYVLEPVLEQLQ